MFESELSTQLSIVVSLTPPPHACPALQSDDTFVTPLMRLQLSSNAFDAEQAAKAAQRGDPGIVVDAALLAPVSGRGAGAQMPVPEAAVSSTAELSPPMRPPGIGNDAPPLTVPPGTPNLTPLTADTGSAASSAALLTAGGSSPMAPPQPVNIGAALYDLLPTDVIHETAAQMRSGFGLLHKWEKRRAEEAKSVESIRSAAAGGSIQRKRSRFASSGTAKDSVVSGEDGADRDGEAADDGSGDAAQFGAASPPLSTDAEVTVPGTAADTAFPVTHSKHSFR